MNREAIKQLVREAIEGSLSGAQDSGKAAPSSYSAPWTGIAYEAHPSQQKFDIAEAAIGLSDLLELADGKACTIEKNKPCDQCSMCRSLGF